MAEAVEPIVLVKAGDPEQKPVLYACPKCGQCVSPKIFAVRDDMAHETARRMAADCYNCKTHNVCSECGETCDKHWTVCRACHRKKVLAAAEIIEASAVQECFGLDSGEFYNTPEDAADDGEEYVFDAEFRPFSVSEGLYEQILDDHHDDADISDLVGLDKLEAAVAEFNKAQTSGSYDENRKRIASVKHLAAAAA